MFYLYVK